MNPPSLDRPRTRSTAGRAAYSCPCDWIANGTPRDAPLIAGHILLLTDALHARVLGGAGGVRVQSSERDGRHDEPHLQPAPGGAHGRCRRR